MAVHLPWVKDVGVLLAILASLGIFSVKASLFLIGMAVRPVLEVRGPSVNYGKCGYMSVPRGYPSGRWPLAARHPYIHGSCRWRTSCAPPLDMRNV